MGKIEKLKNVPEWGAGRKNKKYPVKEMGVGELLHLSVDEIGCKDIKSFRAYLWQRSKQLGRHYTCRQLEDGSIEVYRRA